MKGVSAVIAIILILMIVVALAALAWTWFSGIFDQLTTEAGQSITEQQASMSLNFALDAVTCSGTGSGSNLEFTIRNTGRGTLDTSQVSAFVDGSASPGVADQGCAAQLAEGASCTYYTTDTCGTGDIVKVTIESGLSHSYTI